MTGDSSTLPMRLRQTGGTQVPSSKQQVAELSCWNHVGVYGNNTCADLTTYVHCRNCPQYSLTGLNVLQGNLPASYRSERTAHYARKEEAPAPRDSSAVFFRVCSEWLAFPTGALHEIAEHRPIHSLPHRTDGILLGLASVRGELVICISAGHLLRLERLPTHAALRANYRRLLVANAGDGRIAFPVDEILGTERFRTGSLKPGPPGIPGSAPSLIQGILEWQGRAVGLLDTDLLFSTVDRNLS